MIYSCLSQTDLRQTYGNGNNSPMSVRTSQSLRTSNSVRSTARPNGGFLPQKNDRSVNCLFPSSLTIDTDFNNSINDFGQNDGFLEIFLSQPGFFSSLFLHSINLHIFVFEILQLDIGHFVLFNY